MGELLPESEEPAPRPPLVPAAPLLPAGCWRAAARALAALPAGPERTAGSDGAAVAAAAVGAVPREDLRVAREGCC